MHTPGTTTPVIDTARPPRGVYWCPNPDDMAEALRQPGAVLALTPFELSAASRAGLSRMKLTQRMLGYTRRGEPPWRWRQPDTMLMQNEDPFEQSGYMLHEALMPVVNLFALQHDMARGVGIIQRALPQHALDLRIEAQNAAFRGFFHTDQRLAGGTVVFNGTTMQVKIDDQCAQVPSNTIGVWYGDWAGPDHPALCHKHGVTHWWQPTRAIATAFAR